MAPAPGRATALFTGTPTVLARTEAAPATKVALLATGVGGTGGTGVAATGAAATGAAATGAAATGATLMGLGGATSTGSRTGFRTRSGLTAGSTAGAEVSLATRPWIEAAAVEPDARLLFGLFGDPDASFGGDFSTGAAAPDVAGP
jgi:hypothetical protein